MRLMNHQNDFSFLDVLCVLFVWNTCMYYSFQAQLYRAGRFTSVLRLLHAQAPMEDDRKLCEYSLTEGATISALFEPDVDINIEVSTCHRSQKLTISNATSVMALKVQICGVLRCGVAPEKLEIRLGDITLEDPMPLHFYGIKDGSRLDIIKSYVDVRVENNKGDKIFWRLKRKDTIGDVKIKLATSSKITGRSTEYQNPDDSVKVEQLRLYSVSKDNNFDELDEDDETVDNCNIKNNDRLYLMSYKWAQHNLKVTVKKTGRELWAVEQDDTCFLIKVKAQDQTGMPVSTIRIARLAEGEWQQRASLSYDSRTRVQKYKQLIEVSDEKIPVKYKEPLYVVTEEELKAEPARLEQEKEAWLEGLRGQGYRLK